MCRFSEDTPVVSKGLEQCFKFLLHEGDSVKGNVDYKYLGNSVHSCRHSYTTLLQPPSL